MGTLAVPPGDPSKDHLLAVLSLHDAPRAAAARPAIQRTPRLADRCDIEEGRGAHAHACLAVRLSLAGYLSVVS
jgi:hypothetical protein